MKSPGNPDLVDIVGEMDTEVACARIAHHDMVAAAFTLEPGTDTLNRVFMDRTLVGRAVLRVAEHAMEAAGGSEFCRGTRWNRSSAISKACATTGHSGADAASLQWRTGARLRTRRLGCDKTVARCIGLYQDQAERTLMLMSAVEK